MDRDTDMGLRNLFGTPDSKRRTATLYLLLMIGIALYFCFLLLRPFLTAITFAAILAMVFYPLHTRVRRLLRSRSIAAGMSTTIVIFLLLIPAFIILRQVTAELLHTYQSLTSSGFESVTSSASLRKFVAQALVWIGWLTGRSPADIRSELLGHLEGVITVLLATAGSAMRNAASIFPQSLIAFFVLFFLFRDGRSLKRRVAAIFPSGRIAARTIFQCTNETLVATFYGVVAVAAVQGILTGIAFAILGLPAPFVWGTATALFALLPVVGTAAIFAPAIAILLLTGHWAKALMLAGWALAIVHPVDNFARPYLIGHRAKLSFLFLFLAILGGLKTFGFVGVFVGPLVFAITVTLLRLYRQTTHLQNSRPIATQTVSAHLY